MTKKKSGFLTFCFSLIPGAGEMYMGFMKQGVTLMVLFWGTIFFGGCLNVPLIMFPLPVIWAYSFFHVHNLAGLSDEEFYAQEDSLLFDWNLFGQIEPKKGRKILAWVLIFIGVSVLWNFMKGMVFMVLDMLNVPTYFWDRVTRSVPQVVFAFLMIYLGVILIRGKKKALEQQLIEAQSKEGDDSYDA